MSDLHNPITVNVQTQFLPEESDPDIDRYVFAYTITLSNQTETAARLLTRHWLITDGNGKTQEVYGEGVVGEQPFIPPGATFTYTSGAILSTPVGCMQGDYQFVSNAGDLIDTEIAPFSLAPSELVH